MNNIIPNAETYQTRILAILNQGNLPTNAQDERIEAIVTEIFNNLGHSNEVRTAVSNLINAPLARVSRIVDSAALTSQMGALTFTIGTRTEQKSEQKTEQESHRASVKTSSMKTREKRETEAYTIRHAAREQDIQRRRIVDGLIRYFQLPADFRWRVDVWYDFTKMSEAEQAQIRQAVASDPRCTDSIQTELNNFLAEVNTCRSTVDRLAAASNNLRQFCEAANGLTGRQIYFAAFSRSRFPAGYSLIPSYMDSLRMALNSEPQYIPDNLETTLNNLSYRCPPEVRSMMIAVLKNQFSNNVAALNALNAAANDLPAPSL